MELVVLTPHKTLCLRNKCKNAFRGSQTSPGWKGPWKIISPNLPWASQPGSDCMLKTFSDRDSTISLGCLVHYHLNKKIPGFCSYTFVLSKNSDIALYVFLSTRYHNQTSFYDLWYQSQVNKEVLSLQYMASWQSLRSAWWLLPSVLQLLKRSKVWCFLWTVLLLCFKCSVCFTTAVLIQSFLSELSGWCFTWDSSQHLKRSRWILELHLKGGSCSSERCAVRNF